jgi:hypothetical protein
MSFLFTKKEPIWINIDIPTKKFTLHKQCGYTEKIKETALKGVGSLKKDGGWLQVKSKSEAEILYDGGCAHFELVNHCL